VLLVIESKYQFPKGVIPRVTIGMTSVPHILQRNYFEVSFPTKFKDAIAIAHGALLITG
jgi:hypothetical protein